MPLPLLGAAGVVSVSIGYVIGRVLVKLLAGLGVGVIAFSGFAVLIGGIESYVLSVLSGVPANVVQLFDILNVGTALSMIFAAFVARFTVAAVIKRIAFK